MLRVTLFALAAVAIISCQKEIHMDFGTDLPLTQEEQDIMASSDEFIAHPAGEVLYSFKKSPRKIRIFTGDSIVCVGPGGGTCVIAPKIFMKKDSTVVGGYVDLYITDILSYGDMIYNGVSTLAGDTILTSVGMMDVVAVQGTDTLLLRPGATIGITFPSAWLPGLRVYTGLINPYPENSITWEAANGRVEPDNPGIYVKEIDTLTWTNIARPVVIPGSSSVYATLPPGFNAANTLTYLLMSSGKTIFNLVEDSNGVFSEGNQLAIPPGMQGKIVVVSKANNKYYYSDKSIMTGTADTVRFQTLTELNINQLHVKLDAL